MAAVNLLLDGFDTSTIGVTLIEAPGRRGMPATEYLTGKAGGAPEHFVLSADPEHARRRLSVDVLLEGSTTAEFYTRLDELNSRLNRRDEIKVSFSDITGRHFKCHLEEGPPEDVNTVITSKGRFTLVFVVPNPFLFEDSETSVTGITTATAIETGTGISTLFRVRVNGAFTDPQITVKSPSGATLFNTLLSNQGAGFSKSVGEWVDLDMGARTIVDDAGANQLQARDLGTDFPFFLDPKDFSFHSSSWPTIETSDGTLDVFLTKAYR